MISFSICESAKNGKEFAFVMLPSKFCWRGSAGVRDVRLYLTLISNFWKKEMKLFSGVAFTETRSSRGGKEVIVQ